MRLPASGRHYREPDRRIADQAASESSAASSASRFGSSALCSPSSTRMCTICGRVPRKHRPAGHRAAPRSTAGILRQQRVVGALRVAAEGLQHDDLVVAAHGFLAQAGKARERHQRHLPAVPADSPTSQRGASEPAAPAPATSFRPRWHWAAARARCRPGSGRRGFVIAGIAHGASPLSFSTPQRAAMACASSCGSPATMPAATTAVAAAGS